MAALRAAAWPVVRQVGISHGLDRKTRFAASGAASSRSRISSLDSSVAQDAQPSPHRDDASTSRLMAKFSGAFAQFEREMTLERQREGIAKARAENLYRGRRPSARLKNELSKRKECGRDEVASSQRTRDPDRRPLGIASFRGSKRASMIGSRERSSSPRAPDSLDSVRFCSLRPVKRVGHAEIAS
jgi:hypothetical protein